jgi:hypothetical protein
VSSGDKENHRILGIAQEASKFYVPYGMVNGHKRDAERRRQ